MGRMRAEKPVLLICREQERQGSALFIGSILKDTIVASLSYLVYAYHLSIIMRTYAYFAHPYLSPLPGNSRAKRRKYAASPSSKHKRVFS